jgi:hypothetical protein
MQIRIREPGIFLAGMEKIGSGIRDEHPESAVLEVVPEELRLGDAGIPDEEDVDVAPEPSPVVQVLLHAAQQHTQQGLTSN